MKSVVVAVMFAGASLLLAPSASADFDPNDIYLGEPGYGGTGCPQGTVTSILSEDGQTLSVLFDAYYAETQPGQRQARSSCNVAVPVHVPQGMSVSILEVDYRGFADIPNNATGTFWAEYFFAGQRGPTRTATFSEGYVDDFLVEDDLQVGAIVWSECGADVILRSNSNIRVRKNSSNGPDGYMAIDSADFGAAIQYQLQWMPCTE